MPPNNRFLICLLVAAIHGLASVLSAAEFKVNDHGAVADGRTINTAFIQSAIDAAEAAGGGTVVFDPGVYVSGALFVKSKVRLHLDEGVVLQAATVDQLYPEMPTRLAGIEMVWPSALINVYQVSDVVISGKGVIDGNGGYWWRKFWGIGRKGGMMAEYEKLGLRWAVDYDCKRVRPLAVFKSRNVGIRDLTVKRAGFWSVSVTYSEQVRIDGVVIRANEPELGPDDGFGPSTDGIDIDSSRDVWIENCDIDCNDDNICLKAGRDWDGLRVNRPTENVVIRNCVTRAGHAMLAFGSDTSGGIRNVLAENLKAYGTAKGIRIKSAKVRGGVLENIRIRHVEMHGVEVPLHFQLNWYPEFSYPQVPEGIDLEQMPAHWKTMTRRVEPPERGIPEVRHLEISGIRATGAKVAVFANAYAEKPISNVRLSDVCIEASKAGSLAHAADWSFDNVEFKVVEAEPLAMTGCENVPMPRISRPGADDWQKGRDRVLEDLPAE